jgi:hypothetical protein
MKFTRTAALVLGAFVAVSGVSFAATVSQSGAAKASTRKVAAAPTMAVHATSGVVKSIDDTKLVISKSANKGPETAFTLNSSTTKDSSIAPGSTVDVRYHTDGKMKVATAVSVHQAKAAVKK